LYQTSFRVLRKSWAGTSYGAYESEKRRQLGLRIAFDKVEHEGWLTMEDLFLVAKPKAHVTCSTESAPGFNDAPVRPSPCFTKCVGVAVGAASSKGTPPLPEDNNRRVHLGAAADPLHEIKNPLNSKPLQTIEGIRIAPGKLKRRDMLGSGATPGVGHSKGAEDHGVRKISLGNIIGVKSSASSLKPTTKRIECTFIRSLNDISKPNSP